MPDITEQKRHLDQVAKLEQLEAIGRLAGGMAHDFNNLLTVIMGNCEVLMATMPESESREMIAEVFSAGQRAASLTRQLLAFSRQQPIAPEALNLNHVLQLLKRTLRFVLGKRVELAIAPADNLYEVLADPEQLEQVILNLAFNARDAMPRGGTFTLATRNLDLDAAAARFHAEAKPGPYAVLAATDSGCGMDEATVARIFEPYFTTKPIGKGSGLGMSMVYGIVKQIGGFIAIESKPGAGSKFELFLPANHLASM